MASIFGHALTAFAVGKGFSKEIATPKFWIIGICCSIIPDADVISFSFGIPYGSFWGHRGFSHSLVFAMLLSVLVVCTFYRKELFHKNMLPLIIYYFICTASHGILDAMTTGGLGVAFFSPLDNSRYFLPLRPIQVSPIGASKFFSSRGLHIILSELLWIGVPAGFFIVITFLFKRR